MRLWTGIKWFKVEFSSRIVNTVIKMFITKEEKTFLN